jgi:hypothetical protein
MMILVGFVGLLFSALGGLMAFLIFFEAYGKHFVDKSKARKQALHGALTAFLFLLGLTLLTAFVVNRFL